MSTVQQVQPNYSLNNNGVYRVKRQAPTNFGISKEKLIIKEASKEFDKKLDFRNKEGLNKIKYFFLWSGKKVHNFLSENSGEKETQLLNAVFTCTLAPLMIWKNPFLKKDEDQKEYAALRQPLSALIAVSGGLAMTIGINDYIDKMVNEGYIKTLDGRFKPSKTCLNKMFKQEFGTSLKNVDLNDQKAVAEFLAKNNLEEIDSDLFAKKPGNFITSWRQRHKVKKAILENYQDKIHTERKKLLVSLIGDKPENISIETVGNDKVIYATRDGEKIELGKNIPNLTTEKELKENLEKYNVYKQNFMDKVKTHGIEVYAEGAQKGITKNSSKQVLNNSKALDFTNEFGISGDATSYATSTGGKPVPEKIDEEVLGKILLKKNDDKRKKGTGWSRKKSTEEGKAESRTTKVLTGGISEPQIRLTDMLDNIRAGKEEVTAKLGSLFPTDITKTKVSEAAEYFIDQLNISDKTGTKKANILDVAENLANNQIKNLDKFKAFKGYTGIIFNLFSTAVTCYVLNWTYPRFIEKFFPELVADKHHEVKGGNK